IGGQNERVELWDVATGQPRATFTVGLQAHVYNVRFSPDSKTLASADTLGTVMFWDVDSGQLQASLRAHSNYVIDLAFSPDGKTELDPEDPDSPVTQNNLVDRLRATGRPKEAQAA